MIFLETNVKDCFLISPNRVWDSRGFFQETFEKQKYSFLPDSNWVQSNWSSSKKNVLRGIHCAQYSKLITCVKGSIWDVVVDLRKDSLSYMRHFFAQLDSATGKQVYVPKGCGHGFLSLEDESCVFYLQSGLYSTLGEETFSYNSFGIDWPYKEEYILSDRDSSANLFKD